MEITFLAQRVKNGIEVNELKKEPEMEVKELTEEKQKKRQRNKKNKKQQHETTI
jgi:hypothetical protein